MKIDDQAVETQPAAPEAPFPSFVVPANPRLWRNTERRPDYAGEVTTLYRDVFTPTRPKQTAKEFVGRTGSIERIIQAVEEERAHVTLFGHQGVGKTSVLNVISEFARRAGYLVARITCTADLTFETLIRAVFEELSDSLTEAPAGDALVKQLRVQQLTDLVDDETRDIPGALKAFDPLSGHQVIVLVDDVHRVNDSGVKTRLQELMAALSDKGAWVQFIVASRHDGLDDVAVEPSDTSRRNVALELELMCPQDIAEIVNRGGEPLGLEFDEDALDAVVQLSRGLPVVTQWLGLLTARRALHQYADRVTLEDIVEASDQTAHKMTPRLNALLDHAQHSDRTAKMGDVLFLAAQSPLREDGVFSALDMSNAAHYVVGRPWPSLNLHRVMSQLCDAAPDPILEKRSSPQGTLYRFANPVMRALVMLRNARRLATMHGVLLAALSVDQGMPEADPSESDDFELWLQFVLTPEEAAQFRRRSQLDETGCGDLQRQFRLARDDGDLEEVLHRVWTILGVSPHRKDEGGSAACSAP